MLIKPTASNFNIIDANERLLQKFGIGKSELLGQMDDLSNGTKQCTEFKKLIIESLHKVNSTAKKQTIENVRFDVRQKNTEGSVEKYWDVEHVPITDANGAVEYIVHIAKDVTEKVLIKKKNLHEEVLSEHEKFKYFVEESRDGLYSMDTEGNFTSVNEALSYLAEVRKEKLLKMNFISFCDSEDRDKILENFNATLQGKTTKFESKFVSAKGNKVILEITLIPIKSGDEITGAYGIAKDLTRIRNSEQIIVKKKKFLEVSATFISSLLEEKLNYHALEEAFELIGETVSVDRMYYFEAHSLYGEDETFISQQIEWASENASPQIKNPEMQNLPESKLKEIMGPLKQNTPFMATIHEVPEGELKQIFVEQDIKSMLLLPIFVNNNLHGFIGFDDCTQERIWSNDEITFLRSLSQNLTTAFENRVTEAALNQREEELKKSEQKFKALVQEGSDLMAIMDTLGNYKFVSDTTTSILGITPKELMGKNAFDFIHPEDNEQVRKDFSKLKEKKQIKISPFRFMDKEGNWRWIETTATNLTEDPAVEGVVTNSKDITTVIKQAEEIKNINERYRLAAKATKDIIYDWDLETDEVVRFNKNPKELLGHPIEEVKKRNFWSNQIHPEDLAYLEPKLKRTLSNKNENFISTEYRFRRADGTYARFIDRGYIIRNKRGKAVRLIGASTDISEIVSKGEAIRNANKRFQLAMEATNEMIWDWKIEEDKMIWSKAFKDLYGYEMEKDHPPKAFWFSKAHPEDKGRVEKSLESAIKNPERKKWKEEYKVFKANGEIAYIVDRAYILRNGKGEAIRMVGAVLDVTPSRKLLEEIQKQNEILKEIAWEQSHIVRAPLVRLKGLLQLLEMPDFEEMSKAEILQNIHSSADELDEIIKKIVLKTEEIGFNQQE